MYRINNWLSAKHRINFKMLVIAHKALHGLAPAYIAEYDEKFSHESLFSSNGWECGQHKQIMVGEKKRNTEMVE